MSVLLTTTSKRISIFQKSQTISLMIVWHLSTVALYQTFPIRPLSVVSSSSPEWSRVYSGEESVPEDLHISLAVFNNLEPGPGPGSLFFASLLCQFLLSPPSSELRRARHTHTGPLKLVRTAELPFSLIYMDTWVMSITLAR